MPEERAAALELLMPGLAAAAREAALHSLASQPGSILLVAVRAPCTDGILPSEERRQDAVTTDGKRLVGGIWLQPQDGGLVFLTGPQLVPGESEESRTALLLRAVEMLDQQNYLLAQALTESATSPANLALKQAGFEEAAVLLYLVALRESFPADEPRSSFSLDAISEKDYDRLSTLLERTFTGTLDCPAVNDDRSPRDSIRGYLATGHSANRWWRFVRERDRDIGCLLLGDFPQFDQLELIYIGLAPEARGRGLGRELVRWAQWLAGSLGRERLVLAVDEANGPAVAMYSATDFHVWQRRHVWLRSS